MRVRRSRPAFELLLVVVAAVVGTVVAGALDLFEHWAEWSRQHEQWEVDEVLTAAVIVVVGLGVYACRRYREAVAESRELVDTQQQLARAHASYRSLFDHHPFSVFSLDRAGSYVAANAASVHLGGYTADELSRMSFADVVLPEDLPRAMEAFGAVLDGTAQQLDLRVRHRAGHVIDVELVGLPMVVGEEGEIVGVYGIAQDITERIRLHRALADALEAARQASTAKSTFLATVSHEIRTPLTSMLGATELLLDAGPDAPRDQLLRTIERGGRRLLTLVNEILDFSHLDAGDPRVDTVPFPLRDVLCDVVALARSRSDAKGLDFDWHVEDDVPATLLGDPGRLAQVLTHLLDNAVKFTDRGRVNLTVARHPQGCVAFAVEDTGVGIAAAQHREVFEPFRQVDESTSRRFGGAGLGLAIVHQLVVAMGGEVRVESEPGQGSRFTVRLPASAVAS